MLVFLALACAPQPAAPHRIVVIGLDGAEWSVIDKLSAAGEMPNLAKLREHGISANMATAYQAASPIVWTTIATGMNMEKHGITGFSVQTPTGSAPVSSTLRKVPAIWNMVSGHDKKVLVAGWWGSYPAEKVNGAIITDRAQKDVPDRFSPAERMGDFTTALAEANKDTLYAGNVQAAPEDRMVTYFLSHWGNDGYDLVLGYLHGTDVVSHEYWKYWEPSAFKDVDPVLLEKNKDVIRNKYKEVDTAIGRIVGAMPPDTNFFVISDHGFRPLKQEFVKVSLDLDEALSLTGLLHRTGTKVDMATTTVYTADGNGFIMDKVVALAEAGREPGGKLAASDAPAVRAKVAEQLARFTWPGGQPVFSLRDAKPPELKHGDFVVTVSGVGAKQGILLDGKPVEKVVGGIVEHSGGHGDLPPGIFVASGPDIDPTGKPEGLRVHDMTPTFLYGMGLPVGEDMDGKARTDVFTAAFQAAHPLQKVPSYGQNGPAKATESKADGEMLDQLRGLGYIE